MNGLNDLRERGGMTWMDEERGWVAALEDVVNALTRDGFAECNREMTTSRRDSQPAGCVSQGINTHTGSVASAIWVNRAAVAGAIVFIAIDGASLEGPGGPELGRDPYADDGGEG